MKTKYRLAAGTAALLASALALPAVSVAYPHLKKLEFGHNDITHRPAMPTVRVRFVAGQWRLVRARTQFDLKLYAKVNVGRVITSVRLIVPLTGRAAANTWQVFKVSQKKGKRDVRLNSIVRTLDRASLDEMGRLAIAACIALGPHETGDFRFRLNIPVKVVIGTMIGTSTSENNINTIRTLTFDAFCDRRPLEARGATMPSPFRVTGAGVELKTVGSGCPRTVFATATILANKPGKVRYVLRSSRGRKWTKTVFLNTQRASGGYLASYAHRFEVGNSTRETFWIEVDGRKVGRPGQLSVVCLSDRPESMTN